MGERVGTSSHQASHPGYSLPWGGSMEDSPKEQRVSTSVATEAT